MRVNSSSRIRWSAIAVLCSIAVAPAVAGATDVSGQRVMPSAGTLIRSRAATPASTTIWHAVRPGVHVLYGTITAVTGTQLNLRLRSGQLFAVDATAAIASDNYSAPLFVGKTVSVDGNETGGRFVASHIFRITNLASLPVDH